MPKTSTNRTVLAYSLHGRIRSDVIDYSDFFARLAEVDRLRRQTSVGSDLVAITEIQPVEQAWLLRFVTGEEGASALLYNPRSGEELVGDLGGNMLAAGAWVLLDPVRRFVAVEQRRPGVSINVMTRTLGHLGVELGILPDRATFDFNPITAPSFIRELDTFARIREASVSVARPNYDWDDSATTLTDYADESDGAEAELTIKAPRGGSLARSNGIVADVKQLVARPIGPLKNLKIRGKREGEQRESTMTLARHQERTSFAVSPGDAPAVERDAFLAAGADLLDRLPDEEDGDGA